MVTEIRADHIEAGQRVYEDGMDEFIAVKVWMHGDTVLLVDIDGGEHSLDCDTVVEVEDAEVFTEIEYRYVDGANNKLDETIYFPGLLTEELRDKIEGACKKIDGRLEFIPHQVEPLQDLPALHWGGEYEDDDDWHQLVSMTVVESALQQKLETTTIAELAEQFAAVDKWDDGSAGPWTMDLPGYGSITAYRSEKDGTMVVEIDTPQATVAEGTSTDNGVPLMRVYVNDDAVWEHPPYPTDGEEPIGFHRLEAARRLRIETGRGREG